MSIGITATDVRDTAARLLKTSSITDDSIDNYLDDAEKYLFAKIAPTYDTTLITSSNAPDELLAAKKYYACFLTILNNYSDKANNQGALELAKEYKRMALDYVAEVISGYRRYSDLTKQSSGNTRVNLYHAYEDDLSDMADDFRDRLSSRYR